MSAFQEQDIIDENGNKLLFNSLNSRFIHIQPWGTKDSTADTDGRLRLRDGKKNYLNKILEYQLKSVKKLTNQKYRFKRKDIDYQLDTNIPTISFVADVTNNKVYWYYFPQHKAKLKLDKWYGKTKTVDLTGCGVNTDSEKLKDILEKIAIADNVSEIKKESRDFTAQQPVKELTSQVQTSLNYVLFTEYQAELDQSRDLINSQQPETALTILDNLKSRVFLKADTLVKFRILTNMAAAKLSIGKEIEASTLFIEAYQYNPDDEKSLANNALAYMLVDDSSKALEFAEKTLAKNPHNTQALSVFLQMAKADAVKNRLDELPSAIKNTSDVYFSLGFRELQKNDYNKAITLFRKAIAVDNNKSLEIRTTLAGALIDKNSPNLKKMEMEGVIKKDNEEVEEAISILNEVWKQIEGTELMRVKTTWLVNRSFAKRILGRYETSYDDAKTAYDLNKTDTKVLKNYAIIAWETNRHDIAYELLSQLNQTSEFPEGYFLRALIRREQKRFDEAIELIKKGIELDGQNEKEDGSGLLIETFLMQGDTEEANRYVEESLKTNANNIMALVYKSRLLETTDKKREAVEIVKYAKKILKENSPIQHQYMVAMQLYRLQSFEDAKEIYEELVDKTYYSETLYKLLYCYYECNEWAKALALCRTITIKHGAIEDVLKIQAAILEEQGDLKGVIATYQTLIESNPHNFNAKVQLGLVFIRQGKLKKAKTYLEATEFNLENMSLMTRYKLAYLYTLTANWQKFLHIAYETRRKFFNDSQAHIEYIKLFLTKLPEKENLFNIKVAEANTAVAIKYPDGKIEWFVIEDRTDINKALREISPSEEFAKVLLTKKVGEKIQIKPHLDVEITEIKSKYIYALHESMSMNTTLFNETADLKKIHFGQQTQGNKLPQGFDQIQEQVTLQHQHSLQVEALYKSKKITLGAFANLIGRNLIELWGGLVSDEKLGIFYANGDFNERSVALRILKEGTQLIIDPIALLTINSLEIGNILVRNYGKPGVTQSTIDLITEQILELEPIKDKGYITLGKQDNKFVKWEIKPETIKKNISYLQNLLDWIKQKCVVVKIDETHGISKADKLSLEQILGIASTDTILAARKKGKVLLSDDEMLRAVARNDYSVNGVWTQAILMDALGKGYITQENYDDLTLKLHGLHYYFTSITGKTLFYALKLSGWKIDYPFITLLKTLEPSSSDTNSTINVSVNFIYELYNQPIVLGNIEEIIYKILDIIIIGRNLNDVIQQLQTGLRERFYLTPLQLQQINEIIRTWQTTRLT